jgi:hypothetical protein
MRGIPKNSEGEKGNDLKKMHKRSLVALQTEPKSFDCFSIY